MGYQYQNNSAYSASPGYVGLRRRLQQQFAPPPQQAGATPPPGAAPKAVQPGPGMAAPGAIMGPQPPNAPAMAPPGNPAMGAAAPAAGPGFGAAAGTTPQTGGGDGDWWRASANWKPGQAQKYAGRLHLRDYFRANPMLWRAIQELQNQAGQDRFSDEERAQFLAPYMQNIEGQFQTAQGELDQSMADRGLTDSSATALGHSNLQGRAAGARSQAIQGLYQSEEQRQQQKQQELMSILGAMQGRSLGGFANQANASRQAQLQQLLAEMQQGGGFGDIFGSLLGAAGSAVGAGGIFGQRPRQR